MLQEIYNLLILSKYENPSLFSLQEVTNPDNENVFRIGTGSFSIEDLQTLLRRANRAVSILNVLGDWLITSIISITLNEKFYSVLGVSETLTAGHGINYHLIWKDTSKFLMYCDTVYSHYS